MPHAFSVFWKDWLAYWLPDQAAVRQGACLVSASLGPGTVLQAQGRVEEAKQILRRPVRRLLSIRLITWQLC